MMNGPRRGRPGPPSTHHDHQEGHGPWDRHPGRRRRGDIRIALLAALADAPGHGYELITRIEERSAGMWRPSPGSVYPSLAMLEDEGLVTAAEQEGKRVFRLTTAGRAVVAQQAEAGDGAPVGTPSRGGQLRGELRHAVGQLAMAAKQVAIAGNETKVEQAVAVVNEARRQLYLLLAAD